MTLGKNIGKNAEKSRKKEDGEAGVEKQRSKRSQIEHLCAPRLRTLVAECSCVRHRHEQMPEPVYKSRQDLQLLPGSAAKQLDRWLRSS